ncbi:MAG TPA: T9SS type A sorting domain-containing protein [Saprospiraceae bacterium]|nr:T9SS type A sorting domain-containing protein [Saprospiraceae bacterium]
MRTIYLLCLFGFVNLLHAQAPLELIIQTSPAYCGLASGAIQLSVSGGVGAYQFQWSDGNTTEDLSAVGPGSYQVTVTDQSGITASISAVVADSVFQPQVNAVVLPNTACQFPNGSVTLEIWPPANYTYVWSNASTTQNQFGLDGGVVIVTVTEGLSCSDTLEFVVENEPDESLIHQAFATNETAPGAQDGTAGCLPAGGVAPYQVLWSTGDTVWTITGLSPGVYSLTLTDQNACTVSGTVYVSAFGCALEPVFYPTNLRCYGDANGKVYLEINNGTAPFQYQWSNGDTTQYPKQLTAGWYQVTVADAANCFGQYAVQITEPPLLEVTIDEVQQVACGGQSGTAWFSVQGGTPPYLPVGANGIFENLGVGYYTIIITDSKNCTATASFGVVEEPDTLAPLISCPPNLVVCGSSPVNYNLPAVTDNCPGHSLALITGLEPGNAFPVGTIINTWEVMDWAGNTASCSFTITTLEQPTVSLLALGHDFNGLGTGFITVTVTGGALEYQWTKDGQPFSMESDLVGISAGVYSLTVTAGNGCTAVLEQVEVLQTSGLAEQDEQHPVRVQPNPGGDQVQLTAEGSGLQMVQLYNFCGQPVWRQDLDGAAIATLQVEELPAGVYWVWVRVGGGRAYRLSWVKQ